MQATLINFQERSAVIELETGEKLKWPIKNLPEDLELGDTFYLKLVTLQDEDKQKIRNMRLLLHDLIN